MLTLSRIRKFFSLYSSFIIFVKKKNKNNPLRLVINYYGLNNMIIPVRYTIPLINKF